MKTPLFTSTFGLHLHSIIRLFDYSIILSLAALALSAPAAEVVVYSPYCKDGLTVSAPSGVYRFPAAYTGHRAVVRIPDASGTPVEAWTGNGDFSPSAAYGTTAGRNENVLDLTLHSPIMPRLLLKSASQGAPTVLANISGGGNCAGDRCKTVAEYFAYLRDKIYDMDITEALREQYLKYLEWGNTNRAVSAGIDTGSTEKTRVRIVRWAVDGTPIYRIATEPEVVLDKRMLLSDRAFLTEADVLADSSSFDLDWAKLQSDVVDNIGVIHARCDVTNVAYLVVIGDGGVSWNSSSDTNSCPKILDRMIERKYGFDRLAPTPVSGSFDGEMARFKFRIDGDETYDDDTPGYTAFQVAVRVSGETTNAWASGIRRLPAKDPEKKVYACSTDDAALAAAISSGKSYVWLCALYNSKYSDTPTKVSSNGWSSATLTVK